MNYIKQVNAFYKFLPNNPLSSNAQCLYSYLLNKNNELGWIKEFTVSNMIVCGFTNLSRQALDRARNELKQKGYIDYKKGYSNQAGTYVIVSFVTQNDTQSDTQDDTQNNTQSGHTLCTLNKLNKTKQNKKENIQRKTFSKPTVEEVKAYCSERKNNVDAEKFCDFYESKGWKVGKESMKDWKASVRTWEKGNNSSPPKPPNKPTNAYHNAMQSEFNDLESFYAN
jgi:hypothetical protein